MVNKIKPLQGELTVPGDKSISHRAIMFASISNGISEINNFLQGVDCLATISCFQHMGILIHNDRVNNKVIVEGKGLNGLSRPNNTLDVLNSGTTMRLIAGILCGQTFDSTLTGDESIQKRPMNRIIAPLNQMNGKITSILGNGCAPLKIDGGSKLMGIDYISPVASAQIKSSLLLAGLYADGKTSVTEPFVSRNHTELMLNMLGAPVKTVNTTATVLPFPKLRGTKIEVPGDISSAAYFIAAALIVPDSNLVIKNVGINPTRDGILRVCKAMGADIVLDNIRNQDSEAMADITIRHSSLSGTEISGSIIPTLIDELPIIAVMACFANGQTVIKDASELKVKESNRIDIMVHNLSVMGADVVATDDGMIINGGNSLKGVTIDSKLDHRIAMSFAIAGLMCKEDMNIIGSECVNISYPNFYDDLNNLSRL